MGVIQAIRKVYTVEELNDPAVNKKIPLPLGPMACRIHVNPLDANGEYVVGATGTVSFRGMHYGARAEIPLNTKHDGSGNPVSVNVASGAAHEHVEDGGFAYVRPEETQISGAVRVEIVVVMID